MQTGPQTLSPGELDIPGSCRPVSPVVPGRHVPCSAPLPHAHLAYHHVTRSSIAIPGGRNLTTTAHPRAPRKSSFGLCLTRPSRGLHRPETIPP